MASSTSESGLPVPPFLQRAAYSERQQWVASGVECTALLCRTMGQPDLAGVDLLDVGCGTKIVKTLLDREIPIGHYTGIDIHPPIIDWLDEHVRDDRFEFRHFNAHNDLYNPGGVPLASFRQLPVDLARFDLVSLFSVFTHLNPEDYVAMLRLVREHAKPGGTLVYSAFLNDPDHPGPWNRAVEAAFASDDPAQVELARRELADRLASKDRGFIDEIPETPLLRARYDKDFALELIHGTGWEVVSVDPPQWYIQHCIVCRSV